MKSKKKLALGEAYRFSRVYSPQVVVVAVPKCWRVLVKRTFKSLKHIKSEKQDHFGLADPQPHYDDARYIDARLPDGTVFTLQLCSGQSNYWGGYTFDRYRAVEEKVKGCHKVRDVIKDSEPLHDFDFCDNEIEETLDGVRYLVKLNFC